ARGHRWFKELASGTTASISEIAEREGVYDSYVKRLIPLALLAPDIVQSICDGSQPATLTAEALKHTAPLPLEWTKHDKSYAPDDRQLTSIRFRLVFTRLVLRPAALDDLSSSDGSLTAQPHSRDTGIQGLRPSSCRTENEHILCTMLADFDPKYPSTRAYFP